MTEEKRTYLQHAFRYGSIIGFVSFLYYLLGYYLEFEKNTFIFDNVYFFFTVTMFITMMIKYRRTQTGRVKFMRYLSIGFVASVVVAFFVSAYLVIRIMVLDPFMIYNIVSMVEQSMKGYNIDMTNPSVLPIMKISYVFANFLVNIFNNMMYILLISAFMVWNNRLYEKNKNSN